MGSGNPSVAYTWCSILPPGFNASTTNSYGQQYLIQLVYNSVASSGLPPASYSFMVLTQGGDTIADTSGGRISGQLGGDGGFIYSTAICGSPASASYACGAYGAWYADPVGTYGFGSVATGHVASQTYYAAENASSGPWLARQTIDTNHTYNTLANTGSPNIYLNGNTIYSGTYTSLGGDNSQLHLIGLGATGISQIVLNSGCLQTSPGVGCPYSLSVSGDITVQGITNTNVLYTSSDIRLKKDVHPLTNALDGIMQLKPVAFTYKTDGVKSFGIVAQDLDKVYPDLVSHGPEANMKSVNYEGLIGPLIGAVQELKYENDDLKRRLQADELREQKLQHELEDR